VEESIEQSRTDPEIAGQVEGGLGEFCHLVGDQPDQIEKDSRKEPSENQILPDR